MQAESRTELGNQNLADSPIGLCECRARSKTTELELGAAPIARQRSTEPPEANLLSDDGKADNDFRRIRVNIDRVLRDMAGAEVALHAQAPAANEGEIKHATDH